MTGSSAAMTDVLDRRALNRALLDRQLLLARSPRPPIEVIAHLVGMQAQSPNPPYVGLWTRLDSFVPDDLTRLILDRQVVRIALMRSTIHLVTADDCLVLRPLIQPLLDRHVNGPYGPALDRVDLVALAAAGRALVEEEPRTFNALGALLRERWPGSDPGILANTIRALVPLVQVPPRGIWRASGPAAHTSAEVWLGRSLDPDPSPDEMVLRYLAAFGPATVQDVQAWSGLTRLGEIVERLRPRLRAFRDERGAELFDLPDAPRPPRDTPAPVRLLPEYDNVLLSYAERTRVISDHDRKRLIARNGIVPGTILVDGFVRGRWRLVRQRRAASVLVEQFTRLSKRDAAAVGREAMRFLAFAAPDADTHDVQFVRPIEES